MNFDTLKVISCSLWDDNISFEPNDWSDVIKELNAQTVLSIPYNYISNVCSDPELLNKYKNSVLRNVAYYLKVVATQNDVLGYLSQNNISAVVLKGTSSARYYPKPEYRTMGDIDILVTPEDFDRTKYILASYGYNLVSEVETHERHVGFVSPSNIEVELHRYFSSVGTHEQREYLDNRLYEGIKISKSNYLPEVENGLVIIGHVAQHLRSGLGLRQIIDWMMYVKANLTDSFWENEFATPARECGFDTLAKITTALCCKYLGLDMGITWCSDVDETTVDSLMRYIMDQGNFGRKQERNTRDTSTVMNNFRNPVALFKYLQAGGKSHWKFARNNKFFGCFAWIYQIGHIIKMGASKRIGLNSLKNSKLESNTIVKLMEDLQIKDY